MLVGCQALAVADGLHVSEKDSNIDLTHSNADILPKLTPKTVVWEPLQQIHMAV